MVAPIKVLDLRDSGWVDGPGRTILETAESLDPSRIQVTIGGFRAAHQAQSMYLKSARSRGLPVLEITERRALDLGVVQQVLAAIDDFDYDLVHTHDFRTDLYGLYCASKRDLPAVSTCHGWIANDTKGRVYRWVDKHLLRRFDKVVTVSATMRDILIEHGVSEERISVIVNALRIEDYEPSRADSALRDSLGLARTDTLVASIGRLSPEKGQGLLLQAMAGLSDNKRSVHVAIIGSGTEEQRLKSLAGKLGVTDRVHFMGFRKDMVSVYNSADLVVQSSFTEGMPNVILEALLMQTPVIATNVGGTAEIVQNEVTGKLVEPGSPAILRTALHDYLSRRDYYNEMASRGRERITEKFNHSDRVSRIACVYESLMREAGS